MAYIDDKGKSLTNMVQKIGRFVRQPGAEPLEDPDLNSAYFYFNVTDDEFQDLVRDIQKEMETEGYEVVSFNSGNSPPQSRTVEVRNPQVLMNMGPWFGPSLKDLDDILLDQVPLFSEEALQAKGSIRTAVFDMKKQKEDAGQRKTISINGNDIVTPWEFLSARLGSIDPRIISAHGTIFSAELQYDKKMRQPVQRGSDAARFLETQVDLIRDKLNDKLSITAAGKHGIYTVPQFNMTSPDAEEGSTSYQHRCRVRPFENSVHDEYNGFNLFELQVARALDSLETRLKSPAVTR